MFFLFESLRNPIAVTIEFDPGEMSRRGRIGAYRRLALHDARDLTAAARAAFLVKFEREVDPDGVLLPEERERRAAYARKAHFARLGKLSANARRARAEAAGRPRSVGPITNKAGNDADTAV